MEVMLTNNDAGSAKFSASLLNPADWSASNWLRLPLKYPSRSTKKTGARAPTSPLMCIKYLACSASTRSSAVSFHRTFQFFRCLRSDQWRYLGGNRNLQYGGLGFTPCLDSGFLDRVKIVEAGGVAPIPFRDGGDVNTRYVESGNSRRFLQHRKRFKNAVFVVA